MYRTDINGKGLAYSGDKTTTGATCQGDYESWIEEGKMLLKKGDKTTVCPACKQIGVLNDGTTEVILDNGMLAILDGAIVTCGCPPGTNRVVAPLNPGTSIPQSKLGYHTTQEETKPVKVIQPKAIPEKTQIEAVDAGFCIVHLPATVRDYGNWLLQNAPEGTREIYDQLNDDGLIKAGSILLLVDPKKKDRLETHNQLAALLNAQAKIDDALAPLTDEEANFLHRHYATIANFTSYADKGIGLAGDSVKTYFEQIEKTLEKIQELHQETFKTHGSLANEIFYSERKRLFNDLDRILLKFVKKDLGLKDYTDMKKALNLSTKSIVHKWNEVGIKEIDGYSTYIEQAAKYVKWMRAAGYISIGFSAAHSANEIHEACVTGREHECTKTKYTEIGSFVSSTGLGIVGGKLGMAACSVALGPETLGLGVLACGLVIGGGAGYVFDKIGDHVGDFLGTKLYEVVGDK